MPHILDAPISVNVSLCGVPYQDDDSEWTKLVLAAIKYLNDKKHRGLEWGNIEAKAPGQFVVRGYDPADPNPFRADQGEISLTGVLQNYINRMMGE